MATPFSCHQTRSNDEVEAARLFLVSFSELLNYDVGGSGSRTPDVITGTLSLQELVFRF
jgi:hypothetical protein